MISVSIDAEDEPVNVWRPPLTLSWTTRAEGQEPTKDESEAAVSAIAGDAESIDVEVLSIKE